MLLVIFVTCLIWPVLAGQTPTRAVSAAQWPGVAPFEEVFGGESSAAFQRLNTRGSQWSFTEVDLSSGDEYSSSNDPWLLFETFNNDDSYGSPRPQLLLPRAAAGNAFVQRQPANTDTGNSKGANGASGAAEYSDNDSAGTSSGSTAASGESDKDFQWSVPAPPAQNSGQESKKEQTEQDLFESFKLDLQEKLVLHKNNASAVSKTPVMESRREMAVSMTSKLCSKILARVVKKPPARSPFVSSVMTRLLTAFNKLKAAGTLIKARLTKMFAAISKRASKSRAVRWIQSVASAAWAKMRVMLTKILSVVIRFLPLILFFTNIIFLGMAISTFVVAPNPLSLIALISTIFSLLSFIFDSSVRMHTRRLTEQALDEGSIAQNMELFGLSWGALKAEELIESGDSDTFETVKENNKPPTKESKKKGRKSSSAIAHYKRFASSDKEDAQPLLPKNLGGNSDDSADEKPVEGEEVPHTQEASAENEQERIKRARGLMLGKITIDRNKAGYKKAKQSFKEAKEKRRREGKNLWNLAKTSVRLVAESLNYGFTKVMRRFGKAWEWAMEVGLRKIIRYFRMLKMFSVISRWFERFSSTMRWMGTQGKYYFQIFDIFRSTATFFVRNADTISSLVKGTITVSASAFDYTIFFAMLLNALTKPVYGLYFAYQGMLEDTTRSNAVNEFRSNKKALTNFLLGSAAMESGVGNEGAFDMAGTELQEIIYIMSYLEQYKVPNMDVQNLRGMNPLEAYTFYDRTTRLTQLLDKMNPAERKKFEGVFVALKGWDIDKTSTSARDNLVSKIQHCVLLSSKRELRTAIRQEALDLFQSSGMSKTKAKALSRVFAQRITFAFMYTPNLTTNPSNFGSEVRLALKGAPNFAQTAANMAKLERSVFGIAIDIMGKETLLEVPQRLETIVNNKAVHVNLLPFRTTPSVYDLYHFLKQLFSASMTPVRQRETARQARLGSIRNQGDCEAVEPTIGIFPEQDRATVNFGDGDCAKVFAASFLKRQINIKVRTHIRELIFGVPLTECAPYSSETFAAIDIVIEQLLLSDLPETALEEAVKHALVELIDRHSYIIEANRMLEESVPPAKVNSIQKLRLLQTVAKDAEEESIFREMIQSLLFRYFGISLPLTDHIVGVLKQMYLELMITKKFCQPCVVRHILNLILSVGITSSEEDAQFLFRLFARVYATLIITHIEQINFAKRERKESFTSESFIFTKGMQNIDYKSLDYASFFYYSKEDQLDDELSRIFDKALLTVENLLKIAEESSSSSSDVVTRIHNFVTRKMAYVGEIAKGRGEEIAQPLSEWQIYDGLSRAYDVMAAATKEAKPSIIKVLKTGQYYPKTHQCVDLYSAAMWTFSMGISWRVPKIFQQLAKRPRFGRSKNYSEAQVNHLVVDLIGLIENVHKYGMEGTSYTLDMRYVYVSKEKKEALEAPNPPEAAAAAESP